MTISPFQLRLVVLFIVITTLFVVFEYLPWANLKSSIDIINQQQPASTTPPVFQTPKLEAKGVVVYDSKQDKVLYGQNEDKALPLASITKIMTALLGYEYLDPEQKIAITDQDLIMGSNAGLEANKTWFYHDLADFMLTTSSNGAAVAIATALTSKTGTSFETLANNKARELNLNSLSYRNPTGLDQNGGPGAIGSPTDVAKLMSYVATYKVDLLSSTKWSSLKKTTTDGSTIYGTNTNLIVKTIPGFIGSKTGFTDLAGGNLTTIFDVSINRPVVVVVLGSSPNGRFTDMQKLITETLNILAK